MEVIRGFVNVGPFNFNFSDVGLYLSPDSVGRIEEWTSRNHRNGFGGVAPSVEVIDRIIGIASASLASRRVGFYPTLITTPAPA